VLFWVSGFDIIYACQDYEFDRDANLNSIPVRLGVPGALRLAAICHAFMIAMLVLLPLLHYWVGPNLDLGWFYWGTISAVAVLLAYEHSLVKPDDLTRVNIAFFNVNAVVSMGLFVATSLDLLVI
jgi:4-hydroxybenzoate polyprenyltransferase